MNRSKCPDCNSVKINLFEDQGDGKCDQCLGKGLGDLVDQFAANLANAKSDCLKCNGTGQCQTCGGTGFVKYENSETGVSNSSNSYSNTYLPSPKSDYSSSSGISADYSSSSDDNGCAVIIGYIIGIVVIVGVVIWLALNIVLPIALLNSALVFTILALCYKERKTLFASLALVGGSYMLLDILKGWLSANFVHNVVGNPVWITGFVYLNAAAIGLSVWFLVQPMWANSIEIEETDKQKSLLLKVGSVLLVICATVTIPIIYHSIQKPALKDFNNQKTQDVSYDVPAINANMASFRLYESGADDIPSEARDYGKIFIQSQTRQVNWEVKFEYPTTQNRVDFTLKAIWYSSDGTVLTEQTFKTYTIAGANNSENHNGYGSNELGGFWQKGFYRVELYADGQKIAEAPFEVRNLGDKKNLGNKSNNIKSANSSTMTNSTSASQQPALKSAISYYNRANSHNRQGNYSLAIEDFTKAIEIDPKLAPAYINRGVAYRKNGNINQAIEDYTKAIQLNTEYDGEAYIDRARAYCLSGEKSLAQADEKRAIELGKTPTVPCQ